MIDTAVSTQCSYCNAPLVDSNRARQHIERLVPFRLTRDRAETELGQFLRSRLWAPRIVKSLRFGGRGLRGVLVPHWAFTGVVRSRYRARVGVHWYRTESYTDSQGKSQTRRTRETEWFDFSGTAARQIEDHLVSASVGLAEKESNAIEPFDLGWAVPFDPRLIAGVEAEVPSISSDRASGTAASELRQEETRRIPNELLPGDSNEIVNVRSEVEVDRCEAILLPVWIGTYQYKGQPRRVLVNGQSGQVAGDVPVSAAKVALAIALVVIIVAAIVIFGVMKP